MITGNIAKGLLTFTLKEGQESISFSSLTTISHEPAQEVKGIRQMQGGKAIYYKTGNQEIDTVPFELSPVTKEEFNFLNDIWSNNTEFTAVFSHQDGYISYENPRVNKQPLWKTITEDDSTFMISLALVCEKIDPKLT